MLASKNTIPAVITNAGGYHWLSVLAGELTVRLRESREVTPGLWPKTIVLSTRSALAANPWQHRTVQMPFPFTRHLDADYIAKYGRKLWDDSIGKQERIKLTNISLQFTGLAKLEAGQRGIEGFFSKGTAKKKEGTTAREEKEAEVRAVKEGSDTPDAKSQILKRERSASTAPEPDRKRSKGPKGIESFLSKSSPASNSPATPISVDSGSTSAASGSATPVPGTEGSDRVSAEVTAQEDDEETAWTCTKCSERFGLPDHVPASGAADWKRASKMEHEDYHFALSLQEGSSPPRQPRPPPSSTSSSSSKTKKKKGKPDIKSFFAPKK